MGLDVYLYHYSDYAKSEALTAEYERLSNAVDDEYPNYNDMTQEQKDESRARCKEIAESLGLSEWGEDDTLKHQIEEPSLLYPEHYFKIGYFRSSYNSGGIDRILRTTCGKSLSWIFEVKNDYHVSPDWHASKDRANQLLEDLRDHALRTDNLKVEKIDFFSLKQDEVPADENAAMELVKKHLEKYIEAGKKEFGSYSSKEGYFYLDEPRAVTAIIPGLSDFLGNISPCVYIAFKIPDEFKWYCEALEIVVETIEYVLAQPDPENYYLHWSG